MNDRTICFLVLPNVHLMDLSGPVQVFYEASQMGIAQYNLEYVGTSCDSTSEQGLSLTNLKRYHDISLKAGDFIFVPGIDFKTFQTGRYNNDVKQIAHWLKKQQAHGVFIASVCSGALILAEAGILNGIKCTTHWKCIEYIKKHYPKVLVQTDQLYVQDKNVYTSAGMASGIDMSLSILEHFHGPILPAKVAREIVVYMRRNNIDSQQTIYLDYQTHFNPAIHQVQDYIISNPDKNPGLEELASLCNLSVRNLTRLFKKTTGHTIVDFKNDVKLEFARTLIHNPNYTIEKIASLCGFQSARHLRRIWNNKMGISVKQYRNRIDKSNDEE